MAGAEPDVWSLPSPAQFVDEIEQAIWDGGAVVALDASIPPGLVGQLSKRLRDRLRLETARPAPGQMPLTLLADLIGCDSGIERLAAFEDQVVIIEGMDLAGDDIDQWMLFMQRFARLRTPDGLAIVFLAHRRAGAEGLAGLDWGGRLKRVDALIWAEFHVPAGQSPLLQDIAVALAAELCGWRLDLIADLVTQRDEDILSPLGWLQRNADLASSLNTSFGNRAFPCPLHLFGSGNRKEVEQRIWRAQLASLFPWIEENRIRLVDRNRKFLRIDEHLKKLNVSEVENMELGALSYQLRRHVSRAEIDQIESLAAMRNHLAHRKPVNPQDFNFAWKLGCFNSDLFGEK